MVINSARYLHPGQKLFISGGSEEKALIIDHNSNNRTEYEPLRSNQEEADGRIILHAFDSSPNGAQTIFVKSPDTDVLVLLLHHKPEINAERIYFLTGHAGKHTNLRRFIPVHILHDRLSERQHSIMLPVYTITGCDTASSFFLVMERQKPFA